MAIKNTRNDIITSALELIGAKAADEPASAADIQTGAAFLDRLVKSWQATGAHLWSRNSATLFVQPAQIEYQIGSTTADHATEEYTATTLSVAAVATDTVITLTSTTGLLVADVIGIKLDTGVLHWTTIASLAPTTITDQMPSGAAIGNTVYFYTTDLGKALRIPDARRKQSGQEIGMIQLGRIDYLNLPNKETSGTPTNFYYDPKKSFGNLFLWPAPTSADTTIQFTYYRPLDVFDTSASSPDFPDEWVEAMVYNLAFRLAPIFGQPIPPGVPELAGVLYANAYEWDQDDADVSLQFTSGA
jgi:hypothetical protein